MIVAPGALLTVSLLLVNLLAAVVCLTQPGELAGAVLPGRNCCSWRRIWRLATAASLRWA